jgi:hypothetical protein
MNQKACIINKPTLMQDSSVHTQGGEAMAKMHKQSGQVCTLFGVPAPLACLPDVCWPSAVTRTAVATLREEIALFTVPPEQAATMQSSVPAASPSWHPSSIVSILSADECFAVWHDLRRSACARSWVLFLQHCQQAVLATWLCCFRTYVHPPAR